MIKRLKTLAKSLDIAALCGESEERQVVLLDSEKDSLPFDRMACPDLIEIGRAWEGLPREADERLPRWSHFRPFDFKSSIDKMCVISVEDWKTHALEFTLYGQHATEFVGLGRPLSLQALREDPKRCTYYEDIRCRAGRAIENDAPQYAHKTLSWNDRGFVQYEILMLPFLQEGAVQRILQPLSAKVEMTGGAG